MKKVIAAVVSLVVAFSMVFIGSALLALPAAWLWEGVAARSSAIPALPFWLLVRLFWVGLLVSIAAKLIGYISSEIFK